MDKIVTNDKQNELLKIVHPHIEHINTIRVWDSYRKKYPELELPSSELIKKEFNTWNKFKIFLGLDVNKSKPSVNYTKEQYIELLEPHKEHLKTMDSWRLYTKLQTELTLPSSETLKRDFISWKELKLAFGLEKKRNFTTKELIQFLTPFKEHLITMDSWDAYSSINPELGLPDSITIKGNFENWEKLNRTLEDYDKLIKIIIPHISELTTTKNWDDFCCKYLDYKLPSSETLIKFFDGWDNIQATLWDILKSNPYLYELNHSSLTKDEFLDLVNHREHLTSGPQWDEYRMQNPKLNLLSSGTLKTRFKSWNEMKKFFGLKTASKVRISTLTEEECLVLLIPYKEHINSIKDWVAFTKQNPNLQLPSKNSLLRYFGTWNDLKKKLGLNINIRTEMISLEKDGYLKLLEPYKEHLRTIKRWERFRIEHPELKLPSSHTLIVNFDGSWFKLKKEFGLRKV
ncbi:hypothetical protein [Lysinibacillus sphaericus]|uniref:hypothetical protein n=1 Tax=Lysinibacillus sphaericus TaxID=1421 RepID=UPI000C18AB6D|nr:hypothetical protein [Lysinibacillus sphaericus]PIJ95606.1 hypothetical protein CTN02_23135 [Lysinibacillus sphaericus]